MPLFTVHSNRAAGEREYDVETLIWSPDARGAALQFYRDWIDVGWRPGIVLVTDIEGGGGPRFFQAVDNILREDES